MTSKYSIDYTVMPQHNRRVLTHHTHDPVEAEEFLMHLLSSGSRIHEIRHDGVTLTPMQSDQMIKVAAERIAGLMVRESLSLDSAATIHRFGFAA